MTYCAPDDSIKAAFLYKRQDNVIKRLSAKGSTFLGNFILALIFAALSHTNIKTKISHQLLPVGKITYRSGFTKQPGKIQGIDDLLD